MSSLSVFFVAESNTPAYPIRPGVSRKQHAVYRISGCVLAGRHTGHSDIAGRKVIIYPV